MSTPVNTGNNTGLPNGTLIADTANDAGAKVQLIQLDILTGTGAASSPVTSLNPLPVTIAAQVGQLDVSIGSYPAGQMSMGNSFPVVIASDQTALAVSGTIAVSGSVAVTGTFWQATQPISAVSLPLPTNAAIETGGNLATLVAKDFATSAKQDTGNSSLATIAAKDFATSAKQDTGNTSLTTIGTNTAPLVVAAGGGYVRQDSTGTIAKETGGNLATIAAKDFATAANQTTELASLAIISAATKLEDTASADADRGIPALAVRQDLPCVDTTTSGDYGFLKTDAYGRLYVTNTDVNAVGAWAVLFAQQQRDVLLAERQSFNSAGFVPFNTPSIGIY